jgi:hypothetical protein
MTTTKVNLANTVEGILPVANGGTGTSTGVAPGGSTTQVQYNNAGAFAGSANFVFDGTNVGIGGASAGARLQITGTTNGASRIDLVNSTSSVTSSFGSVTDGTAVLKTISASALAFGTGDTERMRITSAGEVGIGTTTTNQKLDVNGNIRVGSNQKVMFGPAGFEASIKYNTSGEMQIAPRAGEALTFTNGENGTERFRIGPAGQLGIGGANYGTSGQVLTSGGASAAPTWGSVSLPAGTVRQVVSTNFSTLVTVSGSPASVSGFSATITPASSSNRILVITSVAFGFAGDTYPYALLYRNGTSIFTGTSAGGSQINVFLGGYGTAAAGAYRIMQPSKTVLDSPGTTSAVTYQIFAGSGAGTGYINRQGDQGNVGYIQFPTSTITLMEIVT